MIHTLHLYVNHKILLKRHVKMFAAQHRLCSGNHYDSLCVIDNHRGPSHFIPNLQLFQQKHRRVGYSSDLVKIDAGCGRRLRTLRWISRELFYLRVNRLPQRIKRLSDTAYLQGMVSKQLIQPE